MRRKGEFEDLDTEWKDSILAMNKEGINARIAEIAKGEVENQRLKKEDQQLAETKLAYAEASRVYREASKGAKLRIKWCTLVLSNRGQK